jgi:2-keto-4-pentenoate hydratase
VQENQSSIQKAANILWQAENEGKAASPIRDLIGAQNIQAAYEIQHINTQRKIEKGWKPVGIKIGLTSYAVQKQLGVDQPDYGMLYRETQVQNEGGLDANELLQPKAEAEIAFILGQDIEKEIGLEELVNSIAYARCAIEIVGSRIENWDITIADTIADNASASHFVLGDDKVELSQLDLVNCKMQLYKNTELTSEGSGKACMDNPLNATIWLVNTMVSNGTKLKKGDVLLSGALGPMVPIGKGDKLKANIEGLGDVGLTII